MTYYRNRTTGKIQAHPKSGLGERFNADEVGQDGKPVKGAKATTQPPEASTGTGPTENHKKKGVL